MSWTLTPFATMPAALCAMKNFIFFALFFLGSASASENIVPEIVLNSWGYETMESNEKRQSIKRIVGESWGERQTYYPRFTLLKSCYESKELALTNQRRISEKYKSDSFGGSKSHHDSFVNFNCLYQISTAARTTYLSYQPQILEKYKNYIKNANKP